MPICPSLDNLFHLNLGYCKKFFLTDKVSSAISWLQKSNYAQIWEKFSCNLPLNIQKTFPVTKSIYESSLIQTWQLDEDRIRLADPIRWSKQIEAYLKIFYRSLLFLDHWLSINLFQSLLTFFDTYEWWETLKWVLRIMGHWEYFSTEAWS